MAVAGVREHQAAGRQHGADPNLAFVVCGALGVWLGIHALRAYLTMVVWNVAEDLPATQMGLVALAVWVLGLLGWVPWKLLGGGVRAAWVLGLLFALTTALRQVWPGEVSSPVWAFASLVAWLWWLPAFLRTASPGAAVLSVLGGLTLTVAGQVALHGLDVHVLTGISGALTGVILAAAFALASWRARQTPDGPATASALGAAALGPYLFVQLTLLTNLGRLQVTSGWDVVPAAATALLGLLVALVALAWPIDKRVQLLLAVLAVVLLLLGENMPGPAILAIVPIQVGLALGLSAAFAMPSGRTHLGFVGGAIVFFGLVFMYYSARDALTLLWPVAALGVVVALVRTEPQRQPRQQIWAAPAIALAGLAVSLIPASSAVRATEPAPPELRVFNYNIHQGLDYYSVPSISAIAETIEANTADLVSLQEVNRGWNISGGVDYAAWLRWRFPGYYVVYGPMQTQLFGGLILSKYPIVDFGWQRYPRGQSTNTRGFVWTTISSRAGELTFVTTHLTPYSGFDSDRAVQADVLRQFWRSRPRFIIGGDFNAEPDDDAIRMLQQAGLQDIAAKVGLGQRPTYSAGQPSERIDYIFAGPDVAPVTADVPMSLASDHLPVSATVRVAP
ncbi:MAG TPA: endonuclease/exonuclease/phosphatase family protein [Chloroflexota bacterium]